MTLADRYHQFVVENATTIAAVENALRSLSYIIPGRFADSDFAAEALYAGLNLLRLFNESVLAQHVKSGDGSIVRGAWNAYLAYLRRQSRLLDTILTFLNVAWTVEVPVEMLVHRVLGLTAKLRFVVVLEVAKAAARCYVFWRSNCRPILRNYLPDVVLDQGAVVRPTSQDPNDQLGDLLSEIRMAEGKGEGAIRNYLRKHRTDAYTLVPELSMTPARTAFERARELAHILRPAVYAVLVATTLNRGAAGAASRVRWAAWTLSLSMDVFSEWPSLVALFVKPAEQSDAAKTPPIERNERQVRLIKLLLYLVRDPLYASGSRDYLESLCQSGEKWRLLRPLVETARSYQHLCEKVVYYTLGS